MDDSRAISKNPTPTLKEMQAGKALRKDPRFRAASDLSAAADEITAPAFAQERAYGKIIGSTLARLTKAEAMRLKSESLPQNELKNRFASDSGALPEEQGRGGVIDGKT